MVTTILAAALHAQTRQTAVEVSCTVQAAPPQIAFTWPVDAGATGYTVYRRAAGASSWGASIATLAGADTGWTDTTVAVATAYEYRFDKSGTPGGRGFCRAGIEVPALHSRGTVILVAASNVAAALAGELQTFELDLVADGWRVIRHDVSTGDSVASVKALVVADYNADPSNVNTLILLGHVPVPYSGNIARDGHPDHAGAWPCDGYYGDIDGAWTDTSVNNATAARTENHNIPGDGKFDQSSFPGDLELCVGRVDLSNMPAFAGAEIDLTQDYLAKNHLFRVKTNVCQERAVIDDNFAYGSYPEAFASSGWRNFAPMFGAANVTADDYFTTQNAAGPGYLWSYGCGGGTYTSAGGVGSTTTFNTSDNRNIFTMLFGSYHGDWDSQNNFMRASLCSGWTLTCAWAGRPSWSFWPMALGETIGYSTRYSMNDPSPITSSSGTRGSHMGLMGDPTLRMHIVAPVSALSGAHTAGEVDLDWAASVDASGYYIYRSDDAQGPFTLLTPSPIAGLAYTDTSPLAGDNFYMVRPVRLQVSGSGSYYNLGTGVFETVNVPSAAPTITNDPDDETVTEGDDAHFNVSATGPGPLGYQWQRNGADISGATSANYTLANTTLADDGDNFRCVVTNANGSDTSAAATLTVNAAVAPPIAPAPPGGGGDGGGCSTKQTALWPLLPVLALVLVARRKRVAGK
ncbi:MAG: immunoglobulin domain-containing protein [Planctomycetes bacterium]|nr:immunoglobulin domain-containing protein [Planctomycetota bacterium]